MKKLFAWILLVVMILSTFAGCGCQKQPDPTEGTNATTAPSVEADTSINDVIEYLKAIYKDDGAKTPVDYERFGIVRIAGVPYEVVWTADVGEDLIKIVVNDDGTVTIDVNEKCEKDTPYVLTATVTDENGNSVSHSWNYILPEAVDMIAIVKAAYALKSGESLPYESTLTGKIVAIGTPYNPEYKNITVTIEVEGAEDMPIVCYRLKGEGADELAIGDIITVTGTLTNYNGTIEFAAGCTLDAVTPGERVKAPEDPKEIVDAAYKLGANESLPYEATLTGKIIKINTPYSSQYNNITVEIVVEGRENKPITCYRMKGAGIDDLDVGDTITVKGYIINYVGSAGYSTIEFTAGCQMLSYKNTGKEFNMPTAGKDIVLLAYSLKVDEALPEEATLTGVIRKVDTPYDSNYKNVTVTIIVDGMTDYPIVCFRMKGDGADKIAKGDTVTVKGILKNYKGTVEFDAGCQLLAYTKAVQVGPTVSYKPGTVTEPKADTAYKLGVVQKGISGEPVYYFDGTVANTYYLGTSNDGADAIDVMLKATTGGYYLTFGNGKYINVTQETKEGKLYTNAQISDKAVTVWTWNADLATLVTALNGETYYIGTYNTYTTLSISNISQITGANAGKLDVSSFPSHLMTLEQVTGAASMEEGVQQLKLEYPNGYGDEYKLPASVKVRDDVFTITWKVETENTAAVSIKDGALVFVRQDDEVPYKLIATLTKGEETATVEWEYAVPRIPADIQIVTNPEEGKAYKLALTQGNLGGSVLFLTGNKSGNFFETTDKSYEAVDVYMEKANGGIRVYFMKDGVKTYVDMYEYTTDKVGVEFNTTLTDTSAIYTINTELKALTATFDLAGKTSTRYLGCYNTFNTMSSATVREDGTIDGFPAMFVIVNKETPITIGAAAEEVKEQLPAGPNTAADYTLPASVTLNKVKFDITWSVATANKAAVAVKDNTVDVTMLATGAVDYTLKAVIKNAATGETKEFTWNYTVPALEVSTIKQALEGAEDAFFIVKGVVTLVDGKNIYIQDTTGGICLFFEEAPNGIALGDTVVGTGNRTTYNNLPELANASFEKASGMTLKAKETTYSALTAADLCTYVTLKDLTVTEVYDNNGSYTLPNLTVVDAEGKEFQLYKAQVEKVGGAWAVVAGDTLKSVTGAVGTNKYGDLQIRTTNADQIVVKALPATLDNAVTRLKSQYPNGFDANGNLPTAITIGDTTFTVSWALATDNAAAAKIVGGNQFVTEQQAEAVAYTLTATVSNGTATKQVTFTGTVPAKPAVGKEVVIQIVSDGTFVTDEVYTYTNSNTGKSKDELAVTDDFTKAVVLTAVDNGDGTVRFKTANGKYLYTDGTNVKFTDTADENTIFTLEPSANGVYIKSNVIAYEKPQYLEYYSGYVTVYGMGSNTSIYEFKLLDANSTPPVVVPTAADAAAALKASISTLTNGMELPTTYTYKNTEFAVTWSVEPRTEAATIVAHKLTLTAQTEAVNYTLKATVTLGTDSAEATWTGTVAAAGAVDTTNYGPLTENTAYNMQMVQATVGKTLYVTGAMDGSYLATTETLAEAAVVYVEKIAGAGIRFYIADGATKTYIDIHLDGTKVRPYLTTTANVVWTFNDELGVYTAVFEGTEYYLGTYNDYTTINVSRLSYLTVDNKGVSQFFAECVPASAVTPPVTAPTAAQAAAALKASISTLTNGMDLAATYTYQNTQFAVTWSVETANAEAAKIEGDKLVLTAQAEDVAYTLKAVVSLDTDSAEASWTGTVEKETTTPPAPTGLTMIDKIADLTAGSYKMAAFSSDTYHVWNGTTATSSGKTDLVTSKYTFADGALTVVSGATDDAVFIELEAVAGKENTYYIKSGDQYLTTGTSNRSLALGATKSEWTVADYDKGGVIFSTNGMYLGTSTGTSKVIRCYNNTTNTPYGIVLFKEGSSSGGQTPPAPTVPAAADAAAALQASITELTNGMDLAATYTYENTEFAVAWSVETANAAAAKIDAGKLILTAQAEDVAYTLKAVVSLDADSAEATWTGTVEKETAAPSINTIAEALAASSGDFTVKGVVTMIEGKNVYVQDATGGICLYLSAAPTDLSLGDTVIGTGTRGVYRAMPQLSSATYEKSSGLTLSAKETTIAALTNADLGTYIKLSGVEVTEVYDNSGAYSSPNVTVKDGDKTIQIYKAVVGKTDGTNWDVKVGDIVDVQAAVGTNNGTLQLRNTLATEITVVTVTPPVTAPTASEAANALKASITELTNGMDLATTYIYKETEFAVEWSVETANADAAKIEGGKLVLTAQAEDVTYTLKAKVSLGENFNTVEWTGTVAKQETSGGGATNQYIKVTSADQFTTGSYVMVVSSGYAMDKLSGSWVLAVQPTISGDIVTDTKNAVWTLTVNGSSVTIKDSAGTLIKPKTGNNNGIASGSYDWAWEFNNGTFKFKGTGSDTTTLASNKSSSNQFRAYKNGTISGNTAGYPCDFTLYKLDAE